LYLRVRLNPIVIHVLRHGEKSLAADTKLTPLLPRNTSLTFLYQRMDWDRTVEFSIHSSEIEGKFLHGRPDVIFGNDKAATFSTDNL